VHRAEFRTPDTVTEAGCHDNIVWSGVLEPILTVQMDPGNLRPSPGRAPLNIGPDQFVVIRDVKELPTIPGGYSASIDNIPAFWKTPSYTGNLSLQPGLNPLEDSCQDSAVQSTRQQQVNPRVTPDDVAEFLFQ
jgi:hypothetical protein